MSPSPGTATSTRPTAGGRRSTASTGSDSIEQFATSPLLLSAQELALDAEERTLYEADYSRGILRFRDDGTSDAPDTLRPPLVLRLRL